MVVKGRGWNKEEEGRSLTLMLVVGNNRFSVVSSAPYNRIM